MSPTIESLIQEYDDGRLTRRNLIALLGAALVSNRAGLSSPQDTSTFDAVGRSRDFYVKHLGLKVSRENAMSCFLTFGSNFLALFRSSDTGMNHYCYAVSGYDVGEAARKLRAEGLEPRIEGNRIYFRDPDGLTVQLSAPDHTA